MALIKLAYLLVKTVSKPVSSALKSQTKSHPSFRAACLRMAQLQHRLEITLSRALANAKTARSRSSSGSVKLIRPLDEERAVEMGASLLGELVVFGVAGALVLLEGRSQMEKEALRRQAIEDKFSAIFGEIDALRADLREIRDSKLMASAPVDPIKKEAV